MPSAEVLFPIDPELRHRVAQALAGALAEFGVTSLELSDPRLCKTQTLKARETNLPKVLVEAEPGTTLSAGLVAMLVDERVVRCVGEDAILQALVNAAADATR